MNISKIIFIFQFLALILFMCSNITNKNKINYEYQCYKYYDSRIESKPDEEYCKKCLCIDTARIRLW